MILLLRIKLLYCYINIAGDSVKAELIEPQVDFHKLPHKISAERRQSPVTVNNNMAVVTSL